MSDLAWRRTAQAHQPIRSVHEGQHKRSNQSSRIQQEAKARFSANPIHRTDILRRIYKIGWSESDPPIRSLGQLLNRYIMATFFGESTRSDGQNHIGQSDHLNSYLPVTSRSHSTEILRDRIVRIVSANHIFWTVI